MKKKREKDSAPGRKRYRYFSNLRFILRAEWRFNFRYVLAILAQAPTEVIVSLTAAFLPKLVLDAVSDNAEPLDLILSVGGASFLLIITQLLSYLLARFGDSCRQYTNIGLYNFSVFEKLTDMDFNNFVRGDTRVLKEKAYTAVSRWDYGVIPYLRLNKELYAGIFGFTAFTAIIARCNFWFIPALIGGYALSSLGWLILQKVKDKMKDERAAARLRLNYVTYRSKDFTDAKDIRLYSMAELLLSRIDRHLRELRVFDKRANDGHFINVVFEDVLKCVISLAAYLYLIHMKLTSDMTIGDFSLYFGAITGFGRWLLNIVDAVTNLIESDHMVSDYRNFIDLPDTQSRTGLPAVPACEPPCSIELRDLSFSYDKADIKAVDGISLTIAPGEKLAVVGMNGAGKSTLVKLICGLYLPSSGQVLINGRDSTEYARDEYYKMFTTVFQDVSLLPDSIGVNISLKAKEDTDRARLRRCIELAGLEEKISSLPAKEDTLLVKEINEDACELSGGELQKLILARALYKDAPVMILDEPTAALDPIAENGMYRRYGELTKGRTSIYISHRLSSTRFCDRIILIEDGRIAESGTHDQLMALGGEYARMFETQSRYYKEEAVM